MALDDGPDDDGPGDGGPEDGGPDGGEPWDGGPDGGNEGSRSEAGSPGDTPGGSGSHGDDQDPGDDDDSGDNEDPGDGEGPGGGSGPGNGDGEDPGGGGLGSGGDHRVLPEVTVPLVTLQGRAARAGENRLLGPLDPALARDLAAAAARSPSSRWELTVVDEHGYAVGHGIARPRRGSRQRPRPPGMTEYALPARINITVTEHPAAAAGRPAGPAAPRRPARRLGTGPAGSRHVDTHPARRPGTGRPVRRGAHARVRPPASGQQLRAERAAAPPGPGQGSRVHFSALLTTRARLGLGACRPLRQGRADRRVQRRSTQPTLPPGQTVERLDGHPAQARLARVDHSDGPHLHARAMALHCLVPPTVVS